MMDVRNTPVWAPSEGWCEGLMIRNCCQSSGWARAPFISIPDCEAKSCAHQSQVCKVTVNGVRKWQPRYKQEPEQDFSGNARLFDSRMSQLHIALRCCCILLFCRKIYKSQLISASRVFRILWSWKFAQISSAIKLCRWLFSCEFQFILVLLIIWVHYEPSDSGWSQEQLSCRRFIIKPRICTSNASSSLFRPLLISIDQMGLVTRDCFKQPSKDWS